jgi:hypothetical protein
MREINHLRMKTWDNLPWSAGLRPGESERGALLRVAVAALFPHRGHRFGAMDLFDTLGEISGTNPAAIPYLTKRARGPGSLCLRAAATAYYINGQTNLFVETCERLSREKPEWLLDGPELFWFRDDPALNHHLVPLLEKLYLDPRVASRERGTAVDELEARTNDPAAVLFCARFPQKPAVSVAAH